MNIVVYCLLFLLGFFHSSLYAFLFITVFYIMVVYTLASCLKNSNNLLSLFTVSIVKFVYYISLFIALFALIIYVFISADVPSFIKFILGCILAVLYIYDKLTEETKKTEKKITVREQIDKRRMERIQQIEDYEKAREASYQKQQYTKAMQEQERRNS